MKSIFQSAIDNWPEDEASLIADSWEGLAEDGYSDAEIATLQAKDIAHMERVFQEHDDSADLIARFHAELHRKTDKRLF